MPEDLIQIGRFGIGAFQALSELEEEGDYVEWATATDNKIAYQLIVTKGKADNEYYAQFETVAQGVVKGTRVRVFRQRGYPRREQDELKGYIHSKFCLNYRTPIYVNGEWINRNIQKVSFINGEQLNFISNQPVNINIDEHGYTVTDSGVGMSPETIFIKLLIPGRGKEIPEEEEGAEEIVQHTKVFYSPNGARSPNERRQGRINIQVAGVTIESFDTKGYNLCSSLTVELPASTTLTEDRQHIQLSPQILQAMSIAASKILKIGGMKRKIEAVNAIAHMFKEIKGRDERITTVLQQLANEVRNLRDELGKGAPGRYIFIPNEEEFFGLKIPEAKEPVYIDEAVMPWTPAEFPDVMEVINHLETGYRIWTMGIATDRVSFVRGQTIIVNRDYYERHKDNPAALDLEINRQVTGYEPQGREPERIVSILPASVIAPTQEGIKTEKTEEELPDEIRALLEGLKGVYLRIVSERILPLLKGAGSKIVNEAGIWLRRFKALSESFPETSRQDLAAITDALIRKISAYKITQTKQLDYTRVRKSEKLKEGLELKSPAFSVILRQGKFLGNLAVCNWDDNSISIINPETGKLMTKLEDPSLGLKGPRGITQLNNGNLAVCNAVDGSISVIEFEEMKKESDILVELFDEETSKTQNRFKTGHNFYLNTSLLFSGQPGLMRRFSFNLFYIPEALKGAPVQDMGSFLLYMPNNPLRLTSPQLIEDNRGYVDGLSAGSRQQFFSFFEQADMRGFTQRAFGELFNRWIKLFQRLDAHSMKEAKEVFFQFLAGNKNFLDKEHDAEGVRDDFLELSILYLRGDIADILKEEKERPIQGKVTASIDEPFTLGMANMVFNHDPAETAAVGSLGDYAKILKAAEAYVAEEDVGDIDSDINKRIYGQDKSENLFIREDAQNARDAIVLERQAARAMADYYRSYPEDASVVLEKATGFLPPNIGEKAQALILDRIRILDNIAARRVNSGKAAGKTEASEQLSEEYNRARIELRSFIPEGANEWIVSVEDPCGMELKTVVGPLLVLDETTKLGSLASEGVLGMGFYTNFADCDEVRITTGVGDGRFYSLTIARDIEGRLARSSFDELEGDYKGTRVERVKNFTRPVLPDLDAIFVEYNAYRYVAALQDVDIIYKGEKINEGLKPLSGVETPYGALTLYRSGSRYQRITRSLLYVEYPKSEEYFALVPKQYIEIIRSSGFTIDLPKDIPLVRTRLTVSHKEKYMPVIQRAAAALCVKAIIRRYYEEGLLPPGLSEDYFQDARSQDRYGTFDEPAPDLKEAAKDESVRSEFSIEQEVGFINSDELDKVNFERYLVRPADSEGMQELKHRSLKYLITLVAIRGEQGRPFTLAGKRYELLKKVAEAHQKGEVPSLMGEGFGFGGYAAKAIAFIHDEYLAASSPQESFDPNAPDMADFKRLTDFMLERCGLSNVKVGFYKREESRLANFGDNTLRWNLYHIQDYINRLRDILSRKNGEPMDDYEFLRKVLYDVAHEGSHFFDVGKASHESAQELTGLFAWRQRELLRRFIRSGVSWQDILTQVREGRKGPPARSAQPSLPKPGSQKQILQHI